MVAIHASLLHCTIVQLHFNGIYTHVLQYNACHPIYLTIYVHCTLYNYTCLDLYYNLSTTKKHSITHVCERMRVYVVTVSFLLSGKCIYKYNIIICVSVVVTDENTNVHFLSVMTTFENQFYVNDLCESLKDMLNCCIDNNKIATTTELNS